MNREELTKLAERHAILISAKDYGVRSHENAFTAGFLACRDATSLIVCEENNSCGNGWAAVRNIIERIKNLGSL